jgi:hypothetical protein
VAEFLEEAIWRPAGMEADAAWGTDLHGQELTYAFLGATLRDYARFGRLFLNEGPARRPQVVPAAWVAASVRPGATAMAPDAAFGAGFGYGYQWWVPDGGEGDFLAMGIWGQFVYVHPGHRVVIVKTSTDPDFAGRERETVAAFRAIARAWAALAREAAWLPWLAPRLSLRVPEPVAVGRPTTEYPCAWAVYRWVDGASWGDGAVVDERATAAALAGFVGELRALDPVGGPPAGRAPLRELDVRTRAAIEAARGAIDADAALAAWTRALAAPAWDGVPSWIHGDLMRPNLLVRRRSARRRDRLRRRRRGRPGHGPRRRVERLRPGGSGGVPRGASARHDSMPAPGRGRGGTRCTRPR